MYVCVCVCLCCLSHTPQNVVPVSIYVYASMPLLVLESLVGQTSPSPSPSQDKMGTKQSYSFRLKKCIFSATSLTQPSSTFHRHTHTQRGSHDKCVVVLLSSSPSSRDVCTSSQCSLVSCPLLSRLRLSVSSVIAYCRIHNARLSRSSSNLFGHP